MKLALPVAAISAVIAACANAPKPTGQPDAAASSAPVASAVASPKDAAPEAAADPAAVVARGQKQYEKFCGFCHGAGGQGYVADEAPALANEDFLALATDDFIRQAIVNGRPGTTMSAWSVARGGPLSYDDASAIVAYVRTWQKGKLDESERAIGSSASSDRGQKLYAARCASCHGAKGSGGKHNALSNAELLASASDTFLARTIERGRKGTPMPAFGETLSKDQIDDLVALLRIWQKIPDPIPALPPKAGALVNVVVNPRGPEPGFDAKASFIPVDTVKQALDRKAAMVIIDARPPADYARMHIAGAISVPFYEVDAYAKQIPKDRYILTYCACPHAESGRVQAALRALGYPRVAVIDEGLYPWRDRGYPVRGGAKP
ncbi:MAG: c-type cytochrome [Labilithrix sp.]|nr:c-type cytochrome [Labilithrix sp.]